MVSASDSVVGEVTITKVMSGHHQQLCIAVSQFMSTV